jgi:HAD superfamily 5'-nucleotidase-like hydrolase
MAQPDNSHGIFCNRTLNLNSIRAIGYDMDYTLIHYRMEVWEERAYSYIKEKLEAEGWPVQDLTFDPRVVMRGLIIDTDYGNVVKANRFGYVKRAFHGLQPLDFETQRRVYQRTLVDLNEPRWVFLNTLFSISEACLFMQLVDLLDHGRIAGCMGYADLYHRVKLSVDSAHMEGRLKGEVIADPDRFVDLDPQVPLALLDQKHAGKKILLISNSEWDYAAPILSYGFDPFLPNGQTWRDLFDIAIIGAMKPDFFSHRMPAFEVISDQGLLREHRGPLKSGLVYRGGNAGLVEQSLGLKGEEILYVGDHVFADVNISKSILRWRTALVIREIEAEIVAFEQFEEQQTELEELMSRKEAMESEYSRLRLDLQRIRRGYGPHGNGSPDGIEQSMAGLHQDLLELDKRIAPLAQAAGRLLNPNWGPLMRTGADKSHMARQVERYADIYMARVSNFLYATPFAFLRSSRGNLPHDPLC